MGGVGRNLWRGHFPAEWKEASRIPSSERATLNGGEDPPKSLTAKQGSSWPLGSICGLSSRGASIREQVHARFQREMC